MGNAIWDINKYAVDGSMPDYTFFLDINPHIASSRIDSRGKVRIGWNFRRIPSA